MNEIIPIEHRSIRVLTSQQLAEFYKCEPIRIQQNYNSNKKNFREGDHFFVVKNKELKELKKHLVQNEMDIINTKASMIYVWTEKGAMRHAKILETEKAWEVYEHLEVTYFKVKKSFEELVANMTFNGESFEDTLIKAGNKIKDLKLLNSVLTHDNEIKDKHINKLEKENKKMEPKAESFDQFMSSDGLISVANAAKYLYSLAGMGEKLFFQYLRKNKYLMAGNIRKTERNIPYQEYINKGLFMVKQGSYPCGEEIKLYSRTFLTPKGLEYFRDEFYQRSKKAV